MAEPVLSLGAAVVRTALQLWVGDSPIADSVTDLVEQRVSGLMEQRRLKRRFAEFEDTIAQRVLADLEHEFRGLPDNEREAAVLAVADSFDKARLTERALFERDLDSLLLERHIRRQNPRITRDLSEAAVGVYDRVLPECCSYVIATYTTLPDFHAGAFTELLRRDRIILDKLSTILENLPKQSADGDGGAEAAFATAYRRKAAERWDVLQLFGTDATTRTYPLSLAYLSLNVTYPADAERAADPGHAGWWDQHRGGVQSVEEALAANPRLFLRGAAGSGKTTLLHWVAVRASRNDFGPELAAWNGLIPFFVPLRRYVDSALPEPEDFIRHTGRFLAAEAPPGWVQRVLDGGGAVLLVDGVDELPGAQREQARRWLHDLIRDYPRCRFVVTSRPAAAGEDWLAAQDFVSAELEDLREDDIRAFIGHWHAAVRSETVDVDERERLERYERELTDKVLTTQPLRNIASTPLLCALLCALYRDRRTALPRDRLEVYQAALAMLLADRDEQRGIASDGVHLSRTEKTELLQELARWLVCNGSSEMPHQTARRQIERTLAIMHRAEGGPDQVFDYLLVRSGLLNAPTVDRVSFIHRTFEEYLAAKALVEEDSIPQLVRNAHDDQWHEVVVMAAGHVGNRQRAELISGLLTRADQVKKHHDRLLATALACMSASSTLAVELRTEVERRVAGILPPRTEAQVKALITAGEPALPFLTEATVRNAREAEATIRAASGIGGEESVPIIANAARHGSWKVLGALEDAWTKNPSRRFAREVLPQWPQGSNYLFGTHGDHLPLVAECVPDIDGLVVDGDEQTDLRVLERMPGLRCLALRTRWETTWHVKSLDWLRPLKRLASLFLHEDTRVSDVSVLAETHIRYLTINRPQDVRGLESLRAMRELGGVSFFSGAPQIPLSALIPEKENFYLNYLRVEEITDLRSLYDVAHYDIARLTLASCRNLGSLDGIETLFSSLKYFCYRDSGATNNVDLSPLLFLERLNSLSITDTTVEANERVLTRLPLLDELELFILPTVTEPYRLPSWLRDLPSLRTLRIVADGGVDLTDLAGATDLTIRLAHFGSKKVVGADGLGRGSRVVREPRPRFKSS
ncbi:NACHT domain-containing protein [Allosalinactinospora lopnorensis]|uniref:NACHT domain-containing protein n=1 Tax=Allosalinactinospora lopnorensis TaxID=1352348 RepID=UPI000623F285|nr:NACHT domain-containing protein [Allosalinactinospora lopnorensis]